MLEAPSTAAELPRITNLQKSKKTKRSWRLDYAKAANKFELNFISHDKVDSKTKEKLQAIAKDIESRFNRTYYYIELVVPTGCKQIKIYGLAYPRNERGETKVTVYWVNRPEETFRNEITRSLKSKVAEIVTARFEAEHAKSQK